MPKKNQIFQQKPPPNFCLKVVVFKRGGGHTYGKCIADSLNCMHTHQTLEPMKAVPSVLRHLGKFTGGFSSNCVHRLYTLSNSVTDEGCTKHS